MSDIKDSWKKTGSSLGSAFRDLSKSLIKTGKMGVEKAVDWAENDDAKPEYVQTEATETAETPETQQPTE